MKGTTPTYFVETLDRQNWRRDVWPYLRQERAAGRLGKGPVYYIEGDAPGTAQARAELGNVGIELLQFTFDAAQMHDEQGKLIWLRIYYEDMIEALESVTRLPAFARYAAAGSASINLRTWLKKRVLPGLVVWFRSGLWRALYLVHICRWKARRESGTDCHAVVFLDRRVWLEGIADYAAALGDALVVAVGPSRLLLKEALKALLGPVLRTWHDQILRLACSRRFSAPASPAPGIALQYYGHFNLDQPERHSDFFFWQQSALPGRNVLALFDLVQDPLDERRLAALSRHGIRALALRQRATTAIDAPVFLESLWYRRLAYSAGIIGRMHRPVEEQWIKADTDLFNAQREYWRRLFAQHDVKIFTTWMKYSADHCAIAEAIQSRGGVIALYQRSYEGNPTAQATISADIAFVFSGEAAKTEARAHSNIKYCVTTGYLGDHRFPLARSAAGQIRAQLQQRGARYIAAYFDEGSFDDSRWGIGAGRLRAHYAFLLEKILQESKFGLVIKPKTPRTLRTRLGPVADLLEKALATGRCHIYEDGVLQAAIPPVHAALAADLAIHCSVAAGTAAVEAALAGIPTVMVDDDGWTISPLYRLKKDRVIFDDCEALWHTWQEHRRQTNGVPEFADWSPVLDELDPFRDGRAAKRMGAYLKWLIEGYENALPRETVLADAAERYCRAWGTDKVTAVSPTI